VSICDESLSTWLTELRCQTSLSIETNSIYSFVVVVLLMLAVVAAVKVNKLTFYLCLLHDGSLFDMAFGAKVPNLMSVEINRYAPFMLIGISFDFIVEMYISSQLFEEKEL